MRTIARVLPIACLAVLAAAGCGQDGQDGAGPSPRTETVVETVTETEPGAEPDPAPDAAPDAAPAEDGWAMPDLVGTTLQAAQDRIQALTGGGIFYTSSTDLTGRDRNQVLDDNWRVCSQNVAAGKTVTAATDIEFGVVKLDETCP